MTKNSTLFPTPFIISGEINSKNNNQTEIIYEVKPIGFGYYWLKYRPIIGILIFNLILYTQSAPFKIFKIANTFLFVMVIFIYFYLMRKKNRLENDFKKVFGIEN